jgi:hypothetical protein
MADTGRPEDPTLGVAIMRPGLGVAEGLRWVLHNATGVHLLSRRGAAAEAVSSSQWVPCELPVGAPVGVLGIDGPARGAVVVEPLGGRYDVASLVGTRPLTLSELTPVAPAAAPQALGRARASAALRIGGYQGPICRSARRFALGWFLAEYRARAEADGLFGATWLDIALLPHQVAVARHVLSSASIAHVLADEVGLGKTVEALMIWSALSARDPGLRTLITVPRSLVPQWCLEVRRRAEHRLLARWYEDLPRLYVEGDGADAGARGVTIVDHDGLAAYRRTGGRVDLLIVDEAHELRAEVWEVAEQLAEQALHTLFITATPRGRRELTGAARRSARTTAFARVIRAVDPKVEPARRAPTDVEERLEQDLKLLAEAAALATAGDTAGFTTLAARAAVASGARPHGEGEDPSAVLRAATLLERVVRTRRRSLPTASFAERVLVRHELPLRDEEVAVVRALRSLDQEPEAGPQRRAVCASWEALRQSSPDAAVREVLRALGNADTKLESLMDLVAGLWLTDPWRKLVIRCESTPTRRRLLERLSLLLRAGALRTLSEEQRERWGEHVGPVAVLDRDQDAMIDVLRNQTDPADSMLGQLGAFEHWGAGGAVILVANDVGAIGLNLQFASDLILYDVPWKPHLLEQWIGRLDRIGRRAAPGATEPRPIVIHALSHPGLPDWELLHLYEVMGIFTSGHHTPPEIADHVERLIGGVDRGVAWAQVREQALAILADQEEGGAALLEPAPAAVQADPCGADVAPILVRALEAAGLSVERTERITVSWPTGGGELPAYLAQLREALGGAEIDPRTRPDIAAERRARQRRLDLDPERLGGARWIRHGSADFVTPRHPAFADAEAELELDPSVPLGLVSLRTPDVPAGKYLIALGRSFPEAGAHLGLARTGVASLLLEDDADAKRIVEIMSRGLARSICAAAPPRVVSGAWRLAGSVPQPAGPATLEAIVARLGKAQTSGKWWPDQPLLLWAETEFGARVVVGPEVVRRSLREAALFGRQRLGQLVARGERILARLAGVAASVEAQRREQIARAVRASEQLAELEAMAPDVAVEASRVVLERAAIVEVSR